MKLKGLLKGLCILGLTLLPISFSNADSTCMTFDIPDTFVLNKSTVLSFNNLNFSTNINNNNLEHIIYLTVPSSAPSYMQSLQSLFGYYDGKPYLYSAYHQSNTSNDIYQGFPTNVYVESVDTFDVSHITYNTTYESLDSFLNANGFNGGLVCASDGGHMSDNFIYCFKNSTNYYCFKVSAYGGDTTQSTFNTLSGSLGLTTNANFTNINSIEWSISPFNSISQDTFYYSTGSCPSVGQLKAGSNLTPAVCYAGYDGDLIYTAGENTTIQAGSGLTLFETYELFSGNMNIQDWYDTYWTYYNNISFNPYPFYNKPKALLGLMVARQTAGLTRGYNGSYIILNYCYYVLNNVPDSTSTCVGSSVSTQYSGITLTDQDNKDLIDMVNDNFVVHTPGSGSIFYEVGGGGGGSSSWGDDKCDGIPCLFEKFYQMFTSSRVNDVDFSIGGQGILPSYIALAFVVVVLFYVFKR